MWLAVVFALLAVAPFALRGVMPRDPMEPQKITIGAAALLGFCWLGAAAVGLLSLLTAVVAFVRRDRIALAIAVPAPLLAAIGWCMLWLDGM